MIDFSYEREGGKPLGPAVVSYDLTFSDLASGRFQTVRGVFAGEQFAAGNDPLDPKEEPVRTLGIPVTGQRITAE